MSSSLGKLSFLYSGIIFVLKDLYVIALIILLCNTFNWFKRRCRSKQIFGGGKDFCPNFPKLSQKVVVQL